MGIYRGASSTFPIRSASGSRAAGVEGGKVLDCINAGVFTAIPLRTCCERLAGDNAGDLVGDCGGGTCCLFSFSAGSVGWLDGFPSMNWKAFSFFRVWLEGRIGVFGAACSLRELLLYCRGLCQVGCAYTVLC